MSVIFETSRFKLVRVFYNIIIIILKKRRPIRLVGRIEKNKKPRINVFENSSSNDAFAFDFLVTVVEKKNEYVYRCNKRVQYL